MIDKRESYFLNDEIYHIKHPHEILRMNYEIYFLLILTEEEFQIKYINVLFSHVFPPSLSSTRGISIIYLQKLKYKLTKK